MSLASQIESVQPDVCYKLLTEPWFENIAIFKVREKRLDTEVNRALSGLAASNGKGGASIEVLMPSLKTALADTAGPICTLEQKFIVKEQPTVNQGVNGTGLSVEQIAVNIAQTFQLFYLGGAMQGFYVAPEFYKYQPVADDAPFIAVAVTLQATFALSALERTLAPAVSVADETVTLTDQQPGGGSTLYYTTDGSFPGAGNPGANLYSTPFTVMSGATVRVAAYNGVLQGSMVDTFIVN
jgi:hypothetical protein